MHIPDGFIGVGTSAVAGLGAAGGFAYALRQVRRYLTDRDRHRRQMGNTKGHQQTQCTQSGCKDKTKVRQFMTKSLSKECQKTTTWAFEWAY